MHLGIYREFLKRKYIEIVKRGNRLMTPMEMIISTLRACGHLPENIIALDLFGMYGLWVTRDYADICSYLEMYEIDPVYASYAKRFVKKATVVNGDSIEAVNSRHLLRGKYNFIVVDNPFRSPFGKNYCEHFELFPMIGNYIDSGILELSFVYNIEGACLSKEQLERREKFYGKANPSKNEALDVYRKLVGEHKDIIDYVFLPRDGFVSFLCLVLRANK